VDTDVVARASAEACTGCPYEKPRVCESCCSQRGLVFAGGKLRGMNIQAIAYTPTDTSENSRRRVKVIVSEVSEVSGVHVKVFA
jgi:hypothetical protein